MILANLPMKMNSKKNLNSILKIAIVIGILVPIVMIAQSNNSQAGKSICSKISDSSSRTMQRITEKWGRVEGKRAEITNRIQARWQERDSRLLEKQDKWNTNRAQHFQKLRERFQEGEKKQAVIDFQETISEAVANRRAAITEVTINYRQDVQQMKANRQASIDGLKNEFDNAVTVAFEEAEADCNDDLNPGTVRQNLRNDLTAAKEKYHNDYQEIEEISITMDQLIVDRKAAFEEAIQDFKDAMEEAKNEFKAIIGEGGEQESVCINSGGTVGTSSCCMATNDFPNLCLVGPCGCSPENSHEVKICDCGDGECFNGSECLAIQ